MEGGLARGAPPMGTQLFRGVDLPGGGSWVTLYVYLYMYMYMCMYMCVYI